ncbi:YdaS family helix-turn-helix protein [Paraburkholderia sp. RL18-103-BIB-C]|uniref:transcriptional regulator n=1 Tax=Paraburkholderia sp. RL18-103-BIB-C TaxID=3031637 RepID=UPI0038B6DCC3
MGRTRLKPDMRVLAKRGIVAFELAVLIAGNQTRLAKMIGVSEQRISHWKVRDVAIPIEWVPHIVAVIGHPMVTPYTLRPDLSEVWDMLTPQLVACSKGRTRTTMLTEEDYDTVAKIYTPPTYFTRVTVIEREQVSA